jgi:hypothetical protein
MLWHVPTSLASHGLLHMRVLHVFLPTRSCANHLLTCCEGIKIKSPIFKGVVLETFPSLHQAQGSKLKGSHKMPCVNKCVLLAWFFTRWFKVWYEDHTHVLSQVSGSTH